MTLLGRSSSSSQSPLVSHFSLLQISLGSSLLEISLGSSLWFSQHAVMRHIKLRIPEPQQQDSPNSCRISVSLLVFCTFCRHVDAIYSFLCEKWRFSLVLIKIITF